jgi:hypothetical protein
MTEKLATVANAGKATYGWLKKVALQVFGGLFMEQKDEDNDGKYLWVASMGKTAFWITFGHCLYVWNTSVEAVVNGVTTVMRGNVSDGELYALFTLVGYQGAKILKSTVTEGISAFKGGDGA